MLNHWEHLKYLSFEQKKYMQFSCSSLSWAIIRLDQQSFQWAKAPVIWCKPPKKCQKDSTISHWICMSSGTITTIPYQIDQNSRRTSGAWRVFCMVQPQLENMSEIQPAKFVKNLSLIYHCSFWSICNGMAKEKSVRIHTL